VSSPPTDGPVDPTHPGDPTNPSAPPTTPDDPANPPRAVGRAPLSTAGAKIVDREGREFIIQGVNWFGFETSNHVPHGLWSRDYREMLAQIASLGFNTIRLPFSIQSVRAQSFTGVDFSAGRNAALAGKTPIEAMDVIVEEAERQGLLVLLDNHSASDNTFMYGLWYGIDGYTEEDWVETWRALATRYRTRRNVIGADLKNEPHGPATWGTGDATDWRRAAERAGDAVHAIAPHWLIVVEGVEGPVEGQLLDRHWWGGDLEGVRRFPVRLDRPNKLVYSPHEYGPSVFAQPWFSAPNYRELLYDRWAKGFQFIADEGTAPILIGEFGGKDTGTDTVAGVWLRQFMDYLGAHGFSWTYWSWNPDSGDTGGVLLDDWQTVDQGKMDLLRQLIAREPIATR
jgi:endoglucanase